MGVNLGRQTTQGDNALDLAFDAYFDWRDGCDAVEGAYANWTRSRAAEAARAFRAYRRALDREQAAAEAYAAMVRAAEHAQPQVSRQLAGLPLAPGAWWS